VSTRPVRSYAENSAAHALRDGYVSLLASYDLTAKALQASGGGGRRRGCERRFRGHLAEHCLLDLPQVEVLSEESVRFCGPLPKEDE